VEEEIESAVERRGWTEDAELWIRFRSGSGCVVLGGELGAVRGWAKSSDVSLNEDAKTLMCPTTYRPSTPPALQLHPAHRDPPYSILS